MAGAGAGPPIVASRGPAFVHLWMRPMSKKRSGPKVNRRSFFSAVAAAGAASVLKPTALAAQGAAPPRPGAAAPSAGQAAAEQQVPGAEPNFVRRTRPHSILIALQHLRPDLRAT